MTPTFLRFILHLILAVILLSLATCATNTERALQTISTGSRTDEGGEQTILLPEAKTLEAPSIKFNESINWSSLPPEISNTILPFVIPTVSKRNYIQVNQNKEIDILQIPIVYVNQISTDTPELQNIDFTVSPRVIPYDSKFTTGFDLILKQNKRLVLRRDKKRTKYPSVTHKTFTSVEDNLCESTSAKLQATFPNHYTRAVNTIGFSEKVTCTVTKHDKKKSCDDDFITANEEYLIEAMDKDLVVVVKKRKGNENEVFGRYYSVQNEKWYDIPLLNPGIGNFEVRSIFSAGRTFYSSKLMMTLFSTNDNQVKSTCVLIKMNQKPPVVSEYTQYASKSFLSSNWQCFDVIGGEYGIGVIPFDTMQTLALTKLPLCTAGDESCNIKPKRSLPAIAFTSSSLRSQHYKSFEFGIYDQSVLHVRKDSSSLLLYEGQDTTPKTYERISLIERNAALQEIDFTITPRVFPWSANYYVYMGILIENNKELFVSSHERSSGIRAANTKRKHLSVSNTNVMLQATYPKHHEMIVKKDFDGVVTCRLKKFRLRGYSSVKSSCNDDFFLAQGNYMIELWEVDTIAVIDTDIGAENRIYGRYYSVQSETWEDLPFLELGNDDSALYRVRSLYSVNHERYGFTLMIAVSKEDSQTTRTCHLSKQGDLSGSWYCFEVEGGTYGIGTSASKYFNYFAQKALR